MKDKCISLFASFPPLPQCARFNYLFTAEVAEGRRVRGALIDFLRSSAFPAVRTCYEIDYEATSTATLPLEREGLLLHC